MDLQPKNVALLHGFMGNGADWRDVVQQLGPDFRSLRPDLPGHGTNTRDLPDESTLFDHACDQVIAALDEANMPQAALVGYSLGGRIALATALRHPDRFTHLVLESASAGLREGSARHERCKHDDALAAELESASHDPTVFEIFLRDWYAMPLFSTLDEHPALREAMIQRRRDNDPAALAIALRGLSVGRQPDLWPQLENLRIPTLLVVGAHDRKFRILAEEMSERCPKIAVHEMSGCGHNVHAENPDGYTTVVRAFLESP